MPRIDDFLKRAIDSRASDVHFSADEPIRMRVDGDLVPIDPKVYSTQELEGVLFEILTEQEREKLYNHKNLDKSYVVEGVGFFRVNVLWTRRGIAAVLRTIPRKIPTAADLNLPPACITLSEAPKGLVLVTGPTGSGKSTTLAAMINHINTNFPYHILTAEDPVEFVHTSKKSLINQREIGASCATFSDALKYALREDPDVILVGEMRDLETISLALTAAETGHLVFGTLHTRGAGASVDRIIDSFPANQQAMIRTMLSESLVGVVSQSLLKRSDKPGRVAAFEIMVVNHAIANLIREGKTFQIPSIIQTARKDGMVLMDQNILELVDALIVSPEEAEPYLEDPAPLQSRKKKAPTSSAPTATPPSLKVITGTKPAAPPPIAATPAAQKAVTPPSVAAAKPAPKLPPQAPVQAPVAVAAPEPVEPQEAAPEVTGEAVLTDLTSTGEHALDEQPLEMGSNPFESTEDPDGDALALEIEGEVEATNTTPLEAEVAEVNTPVGENPFVPSPNDPEELLNLPNTGEFEDTKLFDRDETATSEIKRPAPIPAAAPPPPTMARPAAPAPSPKPAMPAKAAAPVAPVRSSGPPPASPPPAKPAAAPAPAPAPAATKPAAPPSAPARPTGVPGRPIPPPPPPGAFKKKVG